MLKQPDLISRIMLNLLAMKITPDQFKEIMRLFDAGDFESRRKAVAILYDGYRDYLLNLIKYKYMHNKYDETMAEEVFQDVFLSLLTKQTKPSSAFALHNWMKKYTYNVARDRMKKSGFDVLPYNPEIGEGESVRNTKDSMMIERCVEEIMIACFKDNPEGMAIFSSFKYEGYAYSELTNFYGKSVSNLKKIVSEVNSMLKELTYPCYERI